MSYFRWSFLYQLKVYQFFLVLPLLVMSLSCTTGIQSGDISSKFSGIESVTPLSPTSVKITWVRSKEFDTYQIFSSYQKDPLAESIFSSVIIDKLTPGTTYSFKVIGKGSQVGGGADLELKTTTWSRFEGISNVYKDPDQNLVLEWNYDFPAQEFQIFYRENQAPDETSTSNWSSPNVTTTDRHYNFTNLKKSTTYFFTVQAKYREDEFERVTKSIAGSTTASFPTPYYELSKITIGSLPTVTFEPVISDQFLEKNYTAQVFYKNIPVTDPLRGKGKMTFSSSFSMPTGKISNITLSINYNNGTINETLLIPNLSTTVKKVYENLDTPPVSDAMGPAYMGISTAVGDFNCDGYDDLAIGLPYTSIAKYGAVNKEQGAVYIYYGGYSSGGRYTLKTNLTPLLNPLLPGKDPQVITFPDLSDVAHFGFSMASRGNLNGDKNGTYSCDDLVVGAPGQVAPDGWRSGTAFLFFGTPTIGLRSPATVSGFPQNIETCDGRAQGATCTAVQLWPNHALWPQSATSGAPYAPRRNSGEQFGYSVAFIGDFNADGYEDLAIGAPNGDFDGTPPGMLAATWNPIDVGYVAIYFGSKYGLGLETPTSSPSTEKFRWLKVYPPIVAPYMHFGSALAGGDIDGKHRVRDDNGVYVGGGDLVVGAPGFTYPNPSAMQFMMSNNDANFNRSTLPADGGWWGSNISSAENATNPLYGFPQGTTTATGVAFILWGRSLKDNTSTSVVNNSNDPPKNVFWSCGKRGMTSPSDHYSCLVNPNSFSVLFPRDATSRGFGTAVAIVGDKSAFDAGDGFKCPTTLSAGTLTTSADGVCRDGNGDGFGDIIISAPYSTVSDGTGRTSTGVLWEFFGNYDRVFEAGILGENFKPGVGPYYNTEASCSNFALSKLSPANNGRKAADKAACAPTRLLPNSVPSGASLGSRAQGIAVSDITRDGLQDLLVGAPSDPTRGVNAGAVYAFSSLRGYGITSNFKKFIRNQSNDGDLLGFSLASGDFDPLASNQELMAYTCSIDGSDTCGFLSDSTLRNFGLLPFNDLVVGAPYSDEKRPGGGGEHIFLTGDYSLPAIRTSSDTDIFDSLASVQGYGYGETRLVGDLNGDGYDDAVSHLQSYNSAGAVVYDSIIYYGSSLGLITPDFCLSHLDLVFLPGQVNPEECQPQKTHDLAITQKEIILPQKLIRPNNVSPGWGEIGFSAGDVNRDGFGDLILVDNSASTAQILLYFGTRGGIQDTVIPSKNPVNGDPQIVTKGIGLSKGFSYSSTNSMYIINYLDLYYFLNNPIVHGDFNGDGFSDIAIAVPTDSGPGLVSSTQTSEGETITDVASWPLDSVTNGTIWRCPDGSQLSVACATGGGVSGHGAVYVIYGSSNGLQTPFIYNDFSKDIGSGGTVVSYKLYGTEDDFGQVIEGNTACDGSGSGTCYVTKIENPVLVNIKNGFYALSHFFGASIAPIRVNNTDVADSLLISAPGYEHLNCWNAVSPPQENQGRVYLYRGSKYGILAAPRDKYYPAPVGSNATGDISKCQDMPQTENTGLGFDAFGRTRAFQMIVGSYPTAAEQTGMALNSHYRGWGLNLINAGDINGDGVEDFVVAAPNENYYDSSGSSVVPGVGTAYVVYGPLCPSDNDTTLQSTIQASSNVNKSATFIGMGVMISASCSGKTLAPQKIAIKDVTAAQNANDHYGYSLGGGRLLFPSGKPSGDINMDGFSDVILGAPNWTDVVNNKTNVGRGIVFFGSPTGLFTDDFPSYVVEPLSAGRFKPFMILPPERFDGSQFFLGNVSSGDINGDGSMDLMVPSFWYDGKGDKTGIDLGTFFLFY